MKRVVIVIAGVLAVGAAAALIAGTFHAPSSQPAPVQAAVMHRATFAISNMTCATCPITVRKAMARVAGVKTVAVDFETKKAVVDFDSSRTTVAAIGAASTKAGYPAREITS